MGLKIRALLLASIALAIVILGCGGGGGGSSGGGTGTGGPLTDYQITAYLPSGQMVDPQNVLVGDEIKMKVTARDSNGRLHELSTSGWATTAPAGEATLSSSGVLKAFAASSTPYTISVTNGSSPLSVPFVVSAPQDLVTGSVQNSDGGAVEYAAVDFYDSGGNEVGTAYSTRDGSFRGSVPPTAAKFTLDMSVADPGNVFYYPQFGYGTDQYLEGTSCLAKLGVTLSTNGSAALPSTIIPDIRAGVPPPPPTGCLG